ncbi:hypothetical protein DPSP01_010789 [Paraphaeosphaeria sporulosa]
MGTLGTIAAIVIIVIIIAIVLYTTRKYGCCCGLVKWGKSNKKKELDIDLKHGKPSISPPTQQQPQCQNPAYQQPQTQHASNIQSQWNPGAHPEQGQQPFSPPYSPLSSPPERWASVAVPQPLSKGTTLRSLTTVQGIDTEPTCDEAEGERE